MATKSVRESHERLSSETGFEPFGFRRTMYSAPAFAITFKRPKSVALQRRGHLPLARAVTVQDNNAAVVRLLLAGGADARARVATTLEEVVPFDSPRRFAL